MRAQEVLRTRWGRWALVLFVVVTAAFTVAAGTGGLRTVTRVPPTSAPGEVIDTGQVEVVVTDHVVTDRIDTAALEGIPDADAWLVLRVRALAGSDATVPYVPEVVEVDVPVAEGYEDPSVILVRDGSRSPQLHPGMPEELLLMWPVRAADVPESLVVAVTPQVRFWSALGKDWSWQDGESPVRFEVPPGPALPAAIVEMRP